jgi:LPS sulfotransferase NodH
LEKKTRFIIFGQARSGSTLLVDLLNSHPDIHCDSEIFNKTFWRGWERRYLLPFVRRWPAPYMNFNAARCRLPAYGFKLILKHIKDPRHVLPQMSASGWRILSIQRQDVFTQAISITVAQKTHHWHRGEGQEVNEMELIVPPENVLHQIRMTLARNKAIQDIMAQVPHLGIVYETDLQNAGFWRHTSSRLLDYLGLPPARLTSRWVRTYRRPYSELVKNYEEILAAVRASPYAYVLENISSPLPKAAVEERQLS